MLTPEEQKLVAENEKLIYSYMNRFNLSENEVEDWYGLLAFALCKAARGFDESKGYKFSTYAWTCLTHEVWNLHDRKHSLENVVSFDEYVPGTDNLIYRDILPSDYDLEYEVLQNMDEINSEKLLYRYNKLKPLHKEIIYQHFILDNKQIDIAEKYNVSRQRISKICRDFVEKVKKDFETVK